VFGPPRFRSPIVQSDLFKHLYLLRSLTPVLTHARRCLCVNVVGYDYRGYGCSTFKEGGVNVDGSPLKMSEESVNEDLEAVYAYTVLCHGITPTNVFLIGR